MSISNSVTRDPSVEAARRLGRRANVNAHIASVLAGFGCALAISVLLPQLATRPPALILAFALLAASAAFSLWAAYDRDRAKSHWLIARFGAADLHEDDRPHVPQGTQATRRHDRHLRKAAPDLWQGRH